MKSSNAATVIRANYLLKAKVGSGTIDPIMIKRCQEIIDGNTFDFSPIAQELLINLADTIRKTKSLEISEKEAVHRMILSVMQLKANASIFHYELVGNLALIMLGFLEGLIKLDDTAIEIVAAHHRTLHTIITKKMKGNGGNHGRMLEKELKNACSRYYKTHETNS